MEFFDYIKDNMLQVAPALWAIGFAIKHTRHIDDRYIPAILMTIGALLAIGIDGVSVQSTIQGFLVGGLTVSANTAVKQLSKGGSI